MTFLAKVKALKSVRPTNTKKTSSLFFKTFTNTEDSLSIRLKPHKRVYDVIHDPPVGMYICRFKIVQI